MFSVKTVLSLNKYFHGSYDLRNDQAHWKMYIMFSSLSGKKNLSFFSLEFRWNVCTYMYTWTHKFVCIGGWSKHENIYLGLCFLVASWTSNAKLICWPFSIFWKMHSRWKLTGKNFRLTQLEMFKHSTQWSSQWKIWQIFYISGNMRLHWNYQTGSKCHNKSFLEIVGKMPVAALRELFF